MASGFVPLSRDRGAGGETTTPGPTFKALGKTTPGTLTKSALGDPMAVAAALGLTSKSEAPKISVPPPSAHGHQQMTPVVTARKEGDRITHLIVRCPCGSVTEIECLY